MAIRLNRYLSESGFCSRREADGLIAAGIVTINGELGEFGSRVTPSDVVAVEGERVMPRRSVDFTPRETVKPRRTVSKKSPSVRIDKVPAWLKELREKNPDATPKSALPQRNDTPKAARSKPKSKSRAGSTKKHTPKKSYNM